MRAEFARDVSCQQRIVIADVDPEAAQVVVAETARRPVDRIGDEHVVARPGEREQRKRRRRQPGGHRERRVPALERRERLLEIGDGRQSVQAVRKPGEFAARGAFEIGDVAEQDRRRPEHRRVHRAEEAARIATEMRDVRRRSVAPAIAALRAAHRAFSRSAATMASTCASTLVRMSISIASRGTSSVANWLSSNVAGM